MFSLYSMQTLYAEPFGVCTGLLGVHLTVMSMYMHVYTCVSVCLHSTQGSWSAPHCHISGLFDESIGSFKMQGSFEVMFQGSFRIRAP